MRGLQLWRRIQRQAVGPLPVFWTARRTRNLLTITERRGLLKVTENPMHLPLNCGEWSAPRPTAGRRTWYVRAEVHSIDWLFAVDSQQRAVSRSALGFFFFGKGVCEQPANLANYAPVSSRNFHSIFHWGYHGNSRKRSRRRRKFRGPKGQLFSAERRSFQSVNSISCLSAACAQKMVTLG